MTSTSTSRLLKGRRPVRILGPKRAAFSKSLSPVGRGWGGGLLLLLLLLLNISLANAQPIAPAIDTEKANYVFAVYTPTSRAEATIWRTENTELTTHRLLNKSDSSEIRLSPARHTSLRTFVDVGAVAGAVKIMEEQGSPTLHELLCYDQLLSPAQRQLTESYLAIKHGLTLDQRQPTNYLAQRSDGSTYSVWTATDEPVFRHRITGLAYDTSAHLNRLTGSSVRAPQLLRLSWQETPAETAYLLMADDNLPTARSLDGGETSLQLLQRRWRVEAHGTLPATTLSIDPRQLFARVLPGETLVLVQTGGTSAIIPPTSVSQSQITYANLSVPTDTTSYLQLALRCIDPALGCSTTSEQPENDFFSSVQLSPNPAAAGTPQQLRVALAEAAGLILTVFDVLGRQVSTQALPANTHHLAEITLPAPGTYSLHLRSRLISRSAPSHTIKVVAQ